MYKFLMDKLRPGWRERAAAQRSWWKPIESLLVIAVWGALSFAAWRYLLWDVHRIVNPKTSADFAGFYQHGPSIYLSFAAILAAAPLFCLAGISVNSVVGLIPPLRRLSERGSDRLPELTIKSANRELGKLGLRLAVVAIPVSVLLAIAPFG
jgi:hypothetical protein